MASVGGGAWRSFVVAWLRDVLRFPHRDFDIDTELSQAEVVERLRAIVEPGNIFLAGLRRTNKLFGGEVVPDSFRVMRLIYYGNSSLPVVEGHFEPGLRGARVRVTMRPTRFAQIWFTGWFGFLILFFFVSTLAIVFSPRKNVATGALFCGGAVAMGTFAYLMVLAGPFGIEARKARELLEEALQATPGPRIQRVLDRAPPRLSRWAKYLLGVGAIAVVGSVAGVVVPHLMVGSESYKIAESFIRSNPVVQDELGSVRGVQLELTGNSMSYAGPEGGARYAFDVQGARGNGIVVITLRKHLGEWRIGSAELREADGRIVALPAEAAASGEPGR
jgi:Cytochrome oxidase complex assembly protein 1